MKIQDPVEHLRIKDLPGIHQPEGVDGELDSTHDRQASFSHFLLHKFLLTQTDAMLALNPSEQ